jgi:spermidine/putrescine transport system substrate-binding protein
MLASNILQSAVDRRSFSKLLASLGLGLAVLPLRPAGASGEITYFAYAGYEDPGMHAAYREKYGSSPESAFFADDEAALLKLKNGYDADIAHPCSNSVTKWRVAGVISPIDVSRLRNWDNVIPALKGVAGTSHEGKHWFLPFDWGSNGVAFREDLVDAKYVHENSYRLLWDKRYAGRLGMWDSVDGAVAMAAAILGIKDTAEVSDAEFAAIRDLLAEQRELIAYYWTSETDAETALASGELVASYLWNAPVLRLRQQGIPVQYMLKPKEGVISYVCGMVLLKNGAGDDQAKYDFMNAMTDPESGKFLIENLGYGHCNKKTYTLVSDEVLAERGLSRDPTAYLSNSTFFQTWPPELRDRYIAMFEEVKLGS